MVDFLIDTGADATTLHPRDLRLLKVPQSILDFNTQLTAIGIGGGQSYLTHISTLVMGNLPKLTIWRATIHISDIWTISPKESAMYTPSLLGRDFLNLCDIQANASQGTFTLRPPSHMIVNVPPQSP